VSNRKVFFCVSLFIVLQLFFTYKGVQTIPFFNYGMYSEPAKENPIYEKYILKLDGEVLDFNNNGNPVNIDFLYKNLKLYKELKDPNYKNVVLKAIENRFKYRVSKTTFDRLVEKIWNNNENIRAFPYWLNNFIAKKTRKKINSLEFLVESYAYTGKKMELLKTESILVHEN